MLQLVRDTPLNKVQTEYIEVAYRSAKLLLTIIGDILDLQRIGTVLYIQCYMAYGYVKFWHFDLRNYSLVYAIFSAAVFVQILLLLTNYYCFKQYNNVLLRPNDYLILFVESGKLKLEQIGFDLWSIVTESRDLFKPLAHKKSIALRLNEPIDMHTDTFCGSLSSSVSTIEGSPREISRDFKKMSLDCASSSSSNDGFESIPWVIGDPTRLQQILGNLLSNAIKFTPKHGDIDVNVFIMDYTEEEIELRIEVVDNGVGKSHPKISRLAFWSIAKQRIK
jgi:signal transduction histidine kinase